MKILNDKYAVVTGGSKGIVLNKCKTINQKSVCLTIRIENIINF